MHPELAGVSVTAEPTRAIVHARRSWTLSAIVGVIVICIVVVGLATSLLSLWVGALAIDAVLPGLVPESESGVLVAAAFAAMACGFGGSAAFRWGMFGLRRSVDHRGTWNALTIAVIAIWLLAAFLGYAMISSVAQTVTQLGIGVAGTALGALVLTMGASLGAKSLQRQPTPES